MDYSLAISPDLRIDVEEFAAVGNKNLQAATLPRPSWQRRALRSMLA